MLLDSADQVLTECQDETTTKVNQFDLFRNFFTNLVIRFDAKCSTQLNLLVLIFNSTVFNYRSVVPDFQITLIRVYNNIKVFIGLVLLTQLVAERLLNEGHQSGSVDVLFLFKSEEAFDNRLIFHYL